MNRRILILGSHGMLGQDLVRVFEADQNWEVFAYDRDEIDIASEKSLRAVIEKVEPSAAVNATGYNAVDKCETDEIEYELAKKINWSPEHIKEGRFGNWLEGAHDWSISRQRYWASVMPIWKCEKCAEMKVFGSITELKKISGQKITDLHKHIVDGITFPCAKCEGKMKRIPDVLDTWFDSGSMPYAQMHYPFENKEKFEKKLEELEEFKTTMTQ